MEIVHRQHWTIEEKKKYARILSQGEQRPTRSARVFKHASYWLTILSVLIGTLCIAVLSIPFMLVADTGLIILFLGFLGLCFGFFSDYFLIQTEWKKARYTALVSIFLPSYVFVVFSMAAVTAQAFANVLTLPIIVSPLIAGLSYATGFMFPFIHHMWKR
jgi:hypothetical protein